MTAPEITVVVPSYRRPDLLPRLVAAMEAQTLDRDRFEVVVVDNGSGDETGEVLAKLVDTTPVRLRALTIEENRGPARARNLGWRSATTPFVAFTDDDCVPDPKWLESGLTQLRFSDDVGVVQGRTLKPLDEAGYPYTDWTTYREVLGPSPWFEGCNLFFRREALEATGGFDEDIPFGGEDTVAGWSVVAAGWERVYDQGAVVRHDLGERGVGWHALMGWREGTLLAVARRYPQLRETFWRPWAVRPLNVAFAAGVAGTLGGALLRRPSVVAASWAPWLWLRRPPWRHHRAVRLLAERWWVDAATFAGMKVAAIRERQLVL